MSLRMKLVAVVGALVVILVVPGEAFAQPRPNTYRFVGGTNPVNLNVTCAPGATTGTVPSKVKVLASRNVKKVTPDQIGNSLGQSTKFVASFPGGQITVPRFESFYTLNSAKNFKFPCPANANQAGSFPITLQGYRGNRPVGTPALVHILTHRVGSAS